jgi:hypothetical protein
MDSHRSSPRRAPDSGYDPSRSRRTEYAAQQILDFPTCCNNRLVEVRRCLTEDWWLWLEWTAASNADYLPREFVTIDVLKGGMIYGAR